jgi:DNA-directed RNA polymerase specialized sigma24 family protein
MPYRVVAADAFSTQRQLLWDLCYRVTGTVGDADMLLRDCFSRVVERPLVDRGADWGPHLIRSAAMLSMEALRHRTRRHYVGCWLPSPLETGDAASPAPRPLAATGARYDMVESGSMAFLKALEALTPRERVVFVMCDAFGCRLQEAASTLHVTSATARTLLQSARRRMQRYDAGCQPPTANAQAQAAALLRDCLVHLQNYDAWRLEKTLALDVQAIFDSGGEFVAPLRDISGAGAVAKLLTKFAGGTGPISFAFRMLNGLPAALGQCRDRPRWAKRFVLRIDSRKGLASEIHVIMATGKLTAVRFDPI